MRLSTANRLFRIPQPPQMAKTSTNIISLSRVGALEMNVEVYPGFPGAGLVYGPDGKSVLGVRTNEVGLDRHGRMNNAFEPGMEFPSRITLLAEGAHGSLSKEAIGRFKLREGRDPQTYGLGIKEVWRVDPSKHEPGKVVHSMGSPLDLHTYGGGWAYYMTDGLVAFGLVVGLDYPNPYLSPYREFQSQRMKHRPYFRDILSGSSTRTCIAHGPRPQPVRPPIRPKLNVPGGTLIGCAAGFVNVAKIKDTHNAIKCGMLAAEAAFDRRDAPADMSAYETSLHRSWVRNDLYEVRNARPSFNTSLGILGGVVYSGIDTLLRGRTPCTFRNKLQLCDAAHTTRI